MSTPTPITPGFSRKQVMLGITGCFFLLAALVQFESFPMRSVHHNNGTTSRTTAVPVDSARQARLQKRFQSQQRLKKKRARDGTNTKNKLLDSDNQEEEEEDLPRTLSQPQQPAYHFDLSSIDNGYNGSNPEVLTIRQWGCPRRHEAPLIFVHLGKCGGGSIRARMAASALDYNRSSWGDAQNDPTYYYPIPSEPQGAGGVSGVHKGIFVSSGFHNFRPSYPPTRDQFTRNDMEEADVVWKTFEKTLPCNATTPLGQAVACPLPQLGKRVNPYCTGDRCDVVYAGHNLLGNELHWLPTPYLQQWWNTTQWAGGASTNTNTDTIQSLWEDRANRWKWSPCYYGSDGVRGGGRRPFEYYKKKYFDCVAPSEATADQTAHRALLSSLSLVDSNNNQEQTFQDWSPIYASMPVLRITMMREPFSWLVSKYFWHNGRLRGHDKEWVVLDSCDANNRTNFELMARWAGPAALKQINHLCGEECLVRYEAGIITLDQVETQARHNLQQAFAVVGLLHETQTFYDMITARAAYMDTSLNPEVTGSTHSTQKQEEYNRCKAIYQSSDFQSQLLEYSPELRALVRLYQVGVTVNRHQRNEMETCGLLPPATATTATTSDHS